MGFRPPRRASFRELSLCLAFLLAYAAAAGAAAGCRSDAVETPETETPSERTPPDRTVTEPSDSLGLELVVPPRIRLGQPVPIELRLENRTGRALDLYLRGRTITFDVEVARPGGEVVWQRLRDEIIPAIVHLRTLAPAERLELEAVWDQQTHQGRPVEAGNYTVRGLLLVEGEPLETQSVSLRIEG
jgi:hypothetical protein